MPGARVQGTDGQMVKFASWQPSDKFLCSKKCTVDDHIPGKFDKASLTPIQTPKHACGPSSVQIKFNLPYPIFGCLVMFRDSRSWNQIPLQASLPHGPWVHAFGFKTFHTAAQCEHLLWANETSPEYMTYLDEWYTGLCFSLKVQQSPKPWKTLLASKKKM